MTRKTLSIAIASAAGAGLLLVGCGRDRSPTGPAESPPKSAGVVSLSSLNPAIETDAKQPMPRIQSDMRQRVAHSRRKYRWVGEIHNEAIEDMLAHRQVYFAAGADTDAKICKGLELLARKYSAEVDKRMGLRRSAAEREQLVEVALTQARQCSKGQGISSLGQGPQLLALPAALMQDENSVTGDYQIVVNAMATEIEQSDGSVGSVTAIVDATVNGAGWLPQGDFELVVAAGSVATSSAAEWNAVDQAGAWPSGGVAPMSLGRVVGADILGCAGGIARVLVAMVLGGPGGWLNGAAHCAIGAIVGSGGAAM